MLCVKTLPTLQLEKIKYDKRKKNSSNWKWKLGNRYR
jgi:hypothetical protein